MLKVLQARTKREFYLSNHFQEIQTSKNSCRLYCAKLVKVQEASKVKDAKAIMWEINSMLRSWKLFYLDFDRVYNIIHNSCFLF